MRTLPIAVLLFACKSPAPTPLPEADADTDADSDSDADSDTDSDSDADADTDLPPAGTGWSMHSGADAPEHLELTNPGTVAAEYALVVDSFTAAPSIPFFLDVEIGGD